jgi:hypothetical protein
MAQTRKSGTKSTEPDHQDRDTLTSSAVADPHAVAFAERQRDPSRYDNPTIATPGQLEDIDEDAGKPTALVDPDAPSDLDPSVDNRDQVQPMLDTLAESTKEDALAQGALATAAINAHESDAVDVEALTEEQNAKREEQRSATAESREAYREGGNEPKPTTSDAKTPTTPPKK